MERLTRRYELYDVIDLEAKPNTKCSTICEEMDNCENCPVNVAFKKLADYEDKQEQGLLIELPCKVGDTLYQIGKGHYEIGTDITEYTVTAITISQKDITISVKDENQLGFPISAVYLGKRLYLTRSEAEEALAKMGGK
jgi:hypothetical protein